MGRIETGGAGDPLVAAPGRGTGPTAERRTSGALRFLGVPVRDLGVGRQAQSTRDRRNVPVTAFVAGPRPLASGRWPPSIPDTAPARRRRSPGVGPGRPGAAGRLRHELERALDRRFGVPADWSDGSHDDARAALRDVAGRPLVVAVGGDGTVREAAEAVVGTGVPVAIVPCGTGNVLAGSLRLRGADAAIRLIGAGHRDDDVAAANEAAAMARCGAWTWAARAGARPMAPSTSGPSRSRAGWGSMRG